MTIELYVLKTFYHPLVPTCVCRWINRRREKKWEAQRAFILMLAKESSYWALDRCKTATMIGEKRLVYGESI